MYYCVNKRNNRSRGLIMNTYKITLIEQIEVIYQVEAES